MKIMMINELIDYEYLDSYDLKALKKALIIPLRSNKIYKNCFTCIESDTSLLSSKFLIKEIKLTKEQILFYLSDFEFRKELFLLSKKIINSKDDKSYLHSFINKLLKKASLAKSSDIHIESLENVLLIRFRIDGELKNFYYFEKDFGSFISSFLKQLSKLDITQTRLPMDGRFTYEFEKRKYDFRVSTMPTIYGESIVLRLLDNQDINKNLDSLGFSKALYEEIKAISRLKEGLVLVTGPTGSGKTTTLYSLLNELKNENKKIITVEDPVEYKLEGIQQVEVNEALGLDFNKVLKNILRQDPDVILIGEIRDKNSLDMALRASLTGHLVLASLHANSSLDTLLRLVDLQAELFVIASSLKYVISQRLVLNYCEKCKGEACEECNYKGFKGRSCIAEVLKLDKEISSFILNGFNIEKIKNYLERNEFKTLFDDGKLKVKNEQTSLEQIYKVVGS